MNTLMATALTSKWSSENKLVALVLAAHAHPLDGSIFLSYEEVGKMCGALPTNRVISSIQFLVDKKAIIALPLKLFCSKRIFFLYRNVIRNDQKLIAAISAIDELSTAYAQEENAEFDNEVKVAYSRARDSLLKYIYITNSLYDLVYDSVDKIILKTYTPQSSVYELVSDNTHNVTLTRPSKPKPVDALPKPDYVSQTTWENWLAYRKEIRKPMTATAHRLLLGKLDAIKKSGHDVDNAIKTAIENGWRTVYPPKQNHTPTTDKTKRKFV